MGTECRGISTTHEGDAGRAIARLCVPFLLAFLVAAGSGIGLADDPSEHFTDQLDQRLPEMMDAYGVPGVSISLVADGDLVWSNAYGWADLGSRTPMTVQTVNRAESISKSVTAVGVMTLVEAGRVGLDDRLVDHVERWSFPDAAAGR